MITKEIKYDDAVVNGFLALFLNLIVLPLLAASITPLNTCLITVRRPSRITPCALKVQSLLTF